MGATGTNAFDSKNYKKNNPTNSLRFVQIQQRYTDANGKEVSKVLGFRPQPNTGYDILSNDVLGSGNLELLQKFQRENEQSLNKRGNEPAKKYMEERIRVAKRLKNVEKKAKEDAAIGRKPPQPQLDTKDGFEGFSNLTSDIQTSYNGCWSCSMSLMLKSRGVNLTQEEIRGWRPDYPEGTPQHEKLNDARMRSMNTDTGSTVFENSDIISMALPNTSVGQVMVEPCPIKDSISLTETGGKVREPDDNEMNAIKDAYKEQTKELLQRKITEALKVHRSPVALAWDGHFVTVTGIRPDGTLRLQDSLPSHRRDRTMSMDELVNQGLLPHEMNGVQMAGTGIQMCWLSDLPTQEYGDKEPPDLNEKGENLVKLDKQGTVTLEIPKDHPSTSAFGGPTTGQVRVKGSETTQTLDASNLAKKLGVQKINSFGPGSNVMFATESRLYPKKMVQYGDPELVKSKLKNTDFDVSLSMPGEATAQGQEKDFIKHYNEQIKPYQEALETLGNAAKGWKEDCAKMPQAIETLKGLPDLLKQKQEGCDRTNYELLQRFSGKVEYMKQKLEAINKVVDIGFDSEKLEREIERDKQQGRAKTFDDKLKQIWREGVEDGSLRNQKMCIAKLIAAKRLWKQDKEKGVSFPNPSYEEIEDQAALIVVTPAFEEMTKDNIFNLIEADKYDNDAIDRYDNILAGINQRMDRYAVPEERREAVHDRAQVIAASLDATGTGSYMGVSRSKNSDAFEKAKAAILNTGNSDLSSPAETEKAVTAVLNYLDGKEKVRQRQFGRDRWNACMNFLSETMPRADFEKYCDKVNRARGVGPDSPNYVGPENFLVSPLTTQQVINDAAGRVERGEATLRDYARIVAVRKCAEKDGKIDYERPFGEANLEKLRRETDAVMADPQFKEFIESRSKEEKEALLGVGAQKNAEAEMRNGTQFDQSWRAYQKEQILSSAQKLIDDAKNEMKANPGNKQVIKESAAKIVLGQSIMTREEPPKSLTRLLQPDNLQKGLTQILNAPTFKRMMKDEGVEQIMTMSADAEGAKKLYHAYCKADRNVYPDKYAKLDKERVQKKESKVSDKTQVQEKKETETKGPEEKKETETKKKTNKKPGI